MTTPSGGHSTGPFIQPAAGRQTPIGGHSVEAGGDAYIRRAGKGLILALYAAFRAIRMYPLENTAVQNAVDELTTLTNEMLAHEHELEMRVSGEFVFINSVRLRLDLDNYASFSHLLSVFRAAGIGSLQLHSGPTAKEWQRFLAFLNVPSNDPPATRFA